MVLTHPIYWFSDTVENYLRNAISYNGSENKWRAKTYVQLLNSVLFITSIFFLNKRIIFFKACIQKLHLALVVWE